MKTVEEWQETARKASSDAHHWEAVATNAQEELAAALAKIARMRLALLTAGLYVPAEFTRVRAMVDEALYEDES